MKAESKIVQEVNKDMMSLEDKKFRIYMCSKCKFYINKTCTKKRTTRECSRKGLKNKE